MNVNETIEFLTKNFWEVDSWNDNDEDSIYEKFINYREPDKSIVINGVTIHLIEREYKVLDITGVYEYALILQVEDEYYKLVYIDNSWSGGELKSVTRAVPKKVEIIVYE